MTIIEYNHKFDLSNPSRVRDYLDLIRTIDFEPDYVVKDGEVLNEDAMLKPGDIVNLGENIQII